MSRDISLSVTAREILAYLREHPDAQDTMDGITRWWPQGRAMDRTEAYKAVAELVAAGLIFEINVQGSQPMYRLTQRRRGM